MKKKKEKKKTYKKKKPNEEKEKKIELIGLTHHRDPCHENLITK